MNFSTSAIIAGILFGSIGLYYFRFGKSEARINCMLYGVGLMAYPYFVQNTYLLWGAGVALTFLAHRSSKS